MALIAVIFFGYVCTPLVLNSMLNAEKFKGASKLASAYLTFVPINPEVYAQRAFANINLKIIKLLFLILKKLINTVFQIVLTMIF